MELRYHDGNRLGQSVYVNRLKPYKDRRPTEAPALADDDNFNPTLEKKLDTTLADEENPIDDSDEIEVRDITEHKIKKGKLQYLTTYSDNTTSWQPEDNFISEDGTVTKAVLQYYQQIQGVTHPELKIQVQKLSKLFKLPKVPKETAAL